MDPELLLVELVPAELLLLLESLLQALSRINVIPASAATSFGAVRIRPPFSVLRVGGPYTTITARGKPSIHARQSLFLFDEGAAARVP